MLRTLFITGLYSALLMAEAQAEQATFFNNLSGSWSGFGQAYVGKYGDISVKCRVAITGVEDKVVMNGSCGKLLVQQALGLSIRSTGGSKYAGTYRGSKTGPAVLEGTLHGDRLVMNVRWGGLVNGDRTAQMVFDRTGPNSFALTVNDRIAGKSRRTSRLVFKRL